MNKYTITCEFYDYFSGQIFERETYTSLLEAWSVYKRTKAQDFDYGDSYQHTSFSIVHDASVPLAPQRPHARSAWEWDIIKSAIKNICEDDFDDLNDGLDNTWPEDNEDACSLFDACIDDGLPF